MPEMSRDYFIVCLIG